MENTLKLISDIPPSVNHYLGYRAIMKKGKPVSVSYKTQEAKKYQRDFIKYVQQEVKKQKWVHPVTKEQHFYVDTIFYFPRTDMDANNYFKCLLDAITDTKLVWADDNVVCERVQGIYYDAENPRIELTIYPVEYIGVFKDASQLERFEANCIGCRRSTRNCSIAKKAKEGRIQSEVVDGVCHAYKERK